jgi:aspartate carbamoyltransferase regulatory subunit
MKKDEIKRKHIANALTAVFLNEDHEETDLGLEEINQISDIFKKIYDTLDKEELKKLAMVRPDTFINTMKELEKIDKIFADLNFDAAQ